MADTDDLQIGQLLCSRLCHDLCGPLGAVLGSIELMETKDDADPAYGLLTASAQELASRLAFYRLAFGLRGGTGGTASLAEAKSLASSYFAALNLALEWKLSADEQRVRPADEVRCLLLLLLVAVGAISHRGSVLVLPAMDATPDAFRVEARGTDVRLAPAVVAGLVGGVELREANVRTIHAHVAGRLARSLGTDIDVTTMGSTHLCLAVRRAGRLVA